MTVRQDGKLTDIQRSLLAFIAANGGGHLQEFVRSPEGDAVHRWAVQNSKSYRAESSISTWALRNGFLTRKISRVSEFRVDWFLTEAGRAAINLENKA